MNCSKCKNGHYSGGQKGYAESKKNRAENLAYIYCSIYHDHINIKKSSECQQFQEAPIYHLNKEQRCKHCYEIGIMWCICQQCKTNDIPDENCTNCYGTGTEHHCPKCGTISKPIE